MTTQSSNTVRPNFIGDTHSADALRQEITKGPLLVARNSAFASAADMLGLISMLPDAFIDSQRRELGRLQRTGAGKDPRIENLMASIEQADALRTTAHLGQQRLERVVVALTDSDNVVHGFVSDMRLAPMPGLTVRLAVVTDAADGKRLSAKTDSDGYFVIRIGGRKPPPERVVKLSERIVEVLARVNADATTAADADTGKPKATDTVGNKEVLARIEIFDTSGDLLHHDPAPVVINSGSAYREYVLGDDELATDADYGNVAPAPVAPAAPAPARKPAAEKKKR